MDTGVQSFRFTVPILSGAATYLYLSLLILNRYLTDSFQLASIVSGDSRSPKREDRATVEVVPSDQHHFGKQIQKRQLEVPEYAASFVNYKALKKLIKRLSATPTLSAQNDPHLPPATVDAQVALQANKAKFFFQLERELEKVNAFYLQKEAELKIRLKTLIDKKKVLKSRQGFSRRSAKFTTLEEGFQQFANDLNKLQQFVEINGTAFSKILKKWDKTSKSKTKELYLSRAVEVQPFFNATVISELSDQATTSLQELGAWADGDNVSFEGRVEQHIVSSQHLVGTDEGDADSLLLDTAITGNLEYLRDLLSRMQVASSSMPAMDISLRERVTRTFLAAVNEAPQASLEVLLETGLVDVRSEDDINERNCVHQATIYGNQFVLGVGLSGGVEVNRTDVYGRVPLHYATNPSTIDMIDHDNFTPLIHAIIHGNLTCVQLLLSASSRLDPVSETDHIPLNLACEHGSIEIVEILLRHGARILADAEGLYPQHLVARSGQTPRLLRLLQQYGADLDQIDKLYGWTPLVHAASEGNVPCLQELLSVGVNPNILDEKDLPAMYYAAWEGHLTCMQLLTPFQKGKAESPLAMQATGSLLAPVGSSGGPIPMSLDVDAIPALELPPPIIPLRRYGHNFLDTKTVVQISFDENGQQPLVFFHDSKYPAARLTISSKLSDLIPKNIILPFQEDTRLVSFQVDNLDTFTLDFDVFPTYGAKIIAKTVALPEAFKSSWKSSGRCCLALFDPRLRAIGQITFNTQVIKPFRGAPLEITDFETYWKATSQLDQNPTMFVTGSSLSGEFVQLHVQHTSDGVPIVWPTWKIRCGPVEIPLTHLTYDEFTTVTGTSPARAQLAMIPSYGHDNIAEIHRILSTAGISVEQALSVLPASMHINLQILYPSEDDERRFGIGPTMNTNNFVDSVLAIVFDKAREQRARTLSNPSTVRSVVFSSYNPTMCATLNWKQPNFPVFLCNDLGREEMMPAPNVIQSSGRRTFSVKERSTADAIKSHGLALVVDQSTQQQTHADPFTRTRTPKGVDDKATIV
ncbi:hypothetical protein E0Z10_g1937 [Xylaria hypoxylon]|uniref:Ankyrin repeat protein nuc-2 n=1 Tax=Xylaria hypoxylon TaxID=37992 RepID=A0A4Z0YQX6_9PEZI|nr:hypothetical protein E0Z10_g1937 [Xylaria hypoxylon]